MSIFEFNPAGIPEAVSAIMGFIAENPILCGVLFTAYVLFYVYMFLNNKSADSEVYEIDLLSAGISTITVCFLLIGLDESAKGFDLSNIDFASPNVKIAMFLLAYALLLIFFAFTKILPRFLVVLLGNSELDFFINFIAVLMTDSTVEITGTLLAVILAPLAVLFIIQRLRRLMR